MADPSTCPKSALYRLYMYYLESVQDINSGRKFMRCPFADPKLFLTSPNFYGLNQNFLCDKKKAKLCIEMSHLI